ncbi:hypothetical protein V063_02437, partial [Staphylococcus aureus R0487]
HQQQGMEIVERTISLMLDKLSIYQAQQYMYLRLLTVGAVFIGTTTMSGYGTKG